MIAELGTPANDYIRMNYDRMVVVGVAFVVFAFGCLGGGIPKSARGVVYLFCPGKEIL